MLDGAIPGFTFRGHGSERGILYFLNNLGCSFLVILTHKYIITSDYNNLMPGLTMVELKLLMYTYKNLGAKLKWVG
jgi:hypothetical protein